MKPPNPIPLIRDAVAKGDIEELFRVLRGADEVLTGAFEGAFADPPSASVFQLRARLRHFLTLVAQRETRDPTILVPLGDTRSCLELRYSTEQLRLLIRPTTATPERVKAAWDKLTGGMRE